MEMLHTAEESANHKQKQGNYDKTKQGEQRVHGEHYDKYSDHLYDID